MDSDRAARLRTSDLRPRLPEFLSPASLAAAVAVAILYLAGVKVGSALTAPGQPISTLWPPNALLMAALLVAPRRLWPLFLAVLLPAHVLFQRQLGIPLATSLGWFAGNTGEALLGAALLRRTGGEEPLFGSVRKGIRFVLYAALLAPLVTSFWDAGVVVATGFGTGYWALFSTRLLSNIIAVLLFVPPIVMAFEGGLRQLLHSSAPRRIEALGLAALTLFVCLAADAGPASPYVLVLEVCAPLFCLLWAARRFGPFESSVGILALTLVEIWSSIRGRGAFSSGTPAENVLSLQAYAATIAIPLLLFALAERERRTGDTRLRRNEERLSMSLAVSRLANWDFDLATGELVLSESRVGFLPVRLDPDPPLLFAVVHPEDREEVLRVHDEAVRRRGSYEVECRVYDETGRLRWVHRKGQVVCDESGRPVRVLGVTQDITDRKDNERALAEAKKVAALACTAARMVIWSVDVKTGELFTEPDMPSLLGLGPDARRAPIEFWLNRIHEADRTVIAAIGESLLGISADGRREIEIPELEYRMHHGDGSLRWFLARATLERDPSGSPRRIVGTAMDVTERKKAELEAVERRRELTRLARVTTLGEISATLAHELSQPLTSILANAQAARLMLERETADLAEVGRILDDITSEDRRAGEVIRHLRSLLRKGTPQLQEVEINSVIEEILALMRGDLMTRNVSVETFLEEGLPPARVDPVELRQLLLNLILNACDAMDGNPPDGRVVTITSKLDSSRVVVAVSDVGTGIPEDGMELLFRPFFTTKAHGIGMGLPICQTIVSGCGGLLWAENNPDRGAVFRFALPSATIPASRA